MSADTIGVIVAIVIGAFTMLVGLLTLAFKAGNLVSKVHGMGEWQAARKDQVDQQFRDIKDKLHNINKRLGLISKANGIADIGDD
jgi:hypothetical protein